MSVPIGQEIRITKLTDAEWMTIQSKETFQNQGEWEFISINETNTVGKVLWLEMDQLMYQVQSTGYKVKLN